MSKKDEALKLALEALEVATTPLAKDRQEVLRAQAAIRAALADSALERIAENERELELDYMEPAQQPYAKTAAYIESATNGRMHVDPVTGDVGIGKKQPAQQQCNPHPKAPHGFDRNASHSADRYVCDCESWEPYDAGYQAGFKKGLMSLEDE